MSEMISASRDTRLSEDASVDYNNNTNYYYNYYYNKYYYISPVATTTKSFSHRCLR